MVAFRTHLDHLPSQDPSSQMQSLPYKVTSAGTRDQDMDTIRGRMLLRVLQGARTAILLNGRV